MHAYRSRNDGLGRRLNVDWMEGEGSRLLRSIHLFELEVVLGKDST